MSLLSIFFISIKKQIAEINTKINSLFTPEIYILGHCPKGGKLENVWCIVENQMELVQDRVKFSIEKVEYRVKMSRPMEKSAISNKKCRGYRLFCKSIFYV